MEKTKKNTKVRALTEPEQDAHCLGAQSSWLFVANTTTTRWNVMANDNVNADKLACLDLDVSEVVNSTKRKHQ
jgi:hypothetical protein